MSTRRKYYAVHSSEEQRQRIFEDWDDTKNYIRTLHNPKYKKFATFDEAAYFSQHGTVQPLDLDGTSLILYTDGSAVTGESSGAGVYVSPASPLNKSISLEAPHTNNRAELSAIIAALRIVLEQPKSAIIVSDSKYAIQCITEWREAWERRDMRTAANRPVQNADLLVELWALYDACLATTDVSFKWVKGHAGGTGNEKADQLACDAMLGNN